MGQTPIAETVRGASTGDLLVAETSPQDFTGEVMDVVDDPDPYGTYGTERRLVMVAMKPHRTGFTYHIELLESGRTRVVKTDGSISPMNVRDIEVI